MVDVRQNRDAHRAPDRWHDIGEAVAEELGETLDHCEIGASVIRLRYDCEEESSLDITDTANDVLSAQFGDVADDLSVLGSFSCLTGGRTIKEVRINARNVAPGEEHEMFE